MKWEKHGESLWKRHTNSTAKWQFIAVPFFLSEESEEKIHKKKYNHSIFYLKLNVKLVFFFLPSLYSLLIRSLLMPAHWSLILQRDTPRVKKCFEAASILEKTHMSMSIWSIVLTKILSATSPASRSLSFECMRRVSSLMNGCVHVYQKMWRCGYTGQRGVWSLLKSSHGG